MATKPANAVQKKWMSDVARWASAHLGELFPGHDIHAIQLHHVLGRSAKHNKVAIGHEFILPVPYELHDVNSNHELNVTHHKHAFTDEYGMQRWLFDSMYYSMISHGYTVPSSEIHLAIMDTRA